MDLCIFLEYWWWFLWRVCVCVYWFLPILHRNPAVPLKPIWNNSSVLYTYTYIYIYDLLSTPIEVDSIYYFPWGFRQLVSRWLANISNVDASSPPCSWCYLTQFYGEMEGSYAETHCFFTKWCEEAPIWKPKWDSCWAHVRFTITMYIFPEVWQKNVWIFFWQKLQEFWVSALLTGLQWKVKSSVSGCVRARWIIPILFCSAQLLMLLGQSSEVAELAAAYNRTTAPALFCLFQYQAAGAELMVQHAGRLG